VFARRALAPARVSKVISDPERQVITAIVDEDQLSLAIGRNGQNVRLASQLIGWQIDLYGSREWLERGAGTALFPETEETYEMADFPLEELDVPATALAALKGAGYSSFLDIIDLDRRDFEKISDLASEDADRLMRLIDELTVVENEPPAGGAKESQVAETPGEAGVGGASEAAQEETPDSEAEQLEVEEAEESSAAAGEQVTREG
jgi:N utilization substance protein A